MAEYDNTNTGMMYRNANKENETHPAFTGFINIAGTEYWLSGWINESKDGGKMKAKGIDKYFSLKFKPKEAPAKPEPKKPYDGKGGFEDMDDDIPFISCSLDDDVIFRKLRKDKDQ